MPDLYSSKHIIKILKKHGFELVSQKGSHKKFKMGTFFSILRQSNLQKDDFKS